MTALSDIKPTERLLIMDLVRDTGVDVSDWANVKGGPARAAANPKYCYEWAFGEKGPVIVVTLWFEDIRKDTEQRKGIINRTLELTGAGDAKRTSGQIKRRDKLEEAIKVAYNSELSIRVIVVDGVMRNDNDPKPKASSVRSRLLDPTPWGITSYDEANHLYTLEQGASSTKRPYETSDHVFDGFEGAERKRFVIHRRRERGLRNLKLDQARQANDGRLICEVPNCGFDFQNRYGDLGIGYAEVHHNIPLKDAPKEGRKVKLSDLSVVCANCHAMIHVGGKCRPINALIPR